MSTPELHLATLYESDAGGRLTTTREPAKKPAPIFVLVRGKVSCAWGIRAGIPDALAEELAALARDEPPIRDLHDLPKHVDRYRALGSLEWFGPAFECTKVIAPPSDILVVEDERALAVNFRGWVPGEIAAGCAPVMGIVVDGHPCVFARGVRTSPLKRVSIRHLPIADEGTPAASPQRGQSRCARRVAFRFTARAGRTPRRSRSRASSGSSRTPARGASSRVRRAIVDAAPSGLRM